MEITLMLTDIPLNAVLLFPYASQVWEDLEHRYEGKGNQLALNLFKEVFKDNFVETISMEEQVISLWQKLQKLKDLGYEVNDNLVGMVIMSGLPESYFSLKQHLSMQDESRLTTDFIIKQVLLEEKNHIRPLSQIALVGNTKWKKPGGQTLASSDNSTAWKKNLKCHYCKKKGHIKSECQKLKTDQPNGGPERSKSTTNTDHTAKIATAATKESVVNLFMAWIGASDLRDEWIIDSGATVPMTSRREWFTSYTPFDHEVSIGLEDDSIIRAIGLGSVIISMNVDESSRPFEFRDVYYVPEMGSNNLLSVSYIINKGYLVNFDTNQCKILKKNIIVGSGDRKKQSMDTQWKDNSTRTVCRACYQGVNQHMA